MPHGPTVIVVQQAFAAAADHEPPRPKRVTLDRMTASITEHVESLQAIAQASPALMAALEAARATGLRSWCIGAGAVRNLVWDHLHGGSSASPLEEVDLAYFDPQQPRGHEQHTQEILSRTCPSVTWEVTNQAHVHLWYEQVFGMSVPPLESLEEGVASWPEYATCVGLCLTAQDQLEVLAPHGLSDLFALLVRHNPARVGQSAFAARHSSKRWVERWPSLQIVAP